MLTNEKYFRFKVWYWLRTSKDENDKVVEDDIIIPCNSFIGMHDGKLDFLSNGNIISYEILEKGSMETRINYRHLTREEAGNIISKLSIL